MPKARRQLRNVKPPAEAKKRYEYDVAEPKDDDAKPKPKAAAPKTETKK